MKNILISLALLAGAACCTLAGIFFCFSGRCEEVCTEVLRLHIPANSNSKEDQSIKLALRDHLLNEFSDELGACKDLEAAKERANELLPDIERESNKFLEENGFDYGAKAEIVSMYFTTREYDSLILPAGVYSALRVTLGSGEGNNWWCVIFPQLCLPAASEKQDEASQSVLESFGKPQKVTVKFAIYEFFCSLFK